MTRCYYLILLFEASVNHVRIIIEVWILFIKYAQIYIKQRETTIDLKQETTLFEKRFLNLTRIIRLKFFRDQVIPFSFKKSFFRQRRLISTFLFNFKTKLRHEQFKSTWDKMRSQEEKQNSSNCFTNPSFAYSPATQLFWNSTWWIFGSVKSKLAFLLLTVIVV